MYLIEDFKAYHNANYHDGDNTFDHITYATVEGDNTQFKDQFVQDCYDHYITGYQVGLQLMINILAEISYNESSVSIERLQHLRKLPIKEKDSVYDC